MSVSESMPVSVSLSEFLSLVVELARAGQSADDAPTSPAKKSGKTGKKKRLVDEPQQVAPAGAQPSPSPQGVAATGAPGEDRRQRTVAAPDPKVQKEALEKRCNQGEELLKVTRLVRELNDEAERLKGELRRHRGGGGVAAPVEKRSGAAAKGQLRDAPTGSRRPRHECAICWSPSSEHVGLRTGGPRTEFSAPRPPDGKSQG